MRIALLALHYAEYASRLAIALSARHEVLLLLRSDNACEELTPALRALLEKSVQVRCVEIRRMRDPRVLLTGPSINRIIRRFSPQVVHVQEVHPAHSAGTILGLRGELPVILTVHDPVPHSGSRETRARWKLLYAALPWLRRKAARLIVHGPRLRDVLEALDPRFAGRVDAIAHGLLAQPDTGQPAPTRETATFLFFGRVESYKGLRYLLDAADILQDRGHPVRLIIAGKGTDLEQHRARIAARPWIELIEGYIASTQVSQLFSRPAALVLPYTDATQSGVATIALANSCPVIASATGDLPDIVVDGKTGLLVPPRNAAALADAMQKLLADPALGARFADAAYQHVAEKLGWQRIAELTEATYRRALEASARGSAIGFTQKASGRD